MVVDHVEHGRDDFYGFYCGGGGGGGGAQSKMILRKMIFQNLANSIQGLDNVLK